jgi:hypothetical protein
MLRFPQRQELLMWLSRRSKRLDYLFLACGWTVFGLIYAVILWVQG